MRYRGGVDSYLGSLIAQRDMYDAQRALIVTRLAGAVNLVQLYRRWAAAGRSNAV